MKFLCLGYYDEKKFEAMPKAEVSALVAKCRTHDEALRKSGKLLEVGSLSGAKDSRSIRPRNGKPSHTDGPFTEAKEIVGAFFLIEAADIDDAVRVASLHPAAHLGESIGWGVEVRPVGFYAAGEDRKNDIQETVR
jgi:hypothetical protein